MMLFCGCVWLTNTMVLVILACIRPWVRKSARMLSTKAFRFRKPPGNMGFFAFLSARISPVSDRIAASSTPRKTVEPQPKFCPKEGMHSSRLKKISTKTAPGVSKLTRAFRSAGSGSPVNLQAKKTATQIATHTQIITCQLAAEMIMPPKVGPKITDALEISIYRENPCATLFCGNWVKI